MRVLGYYTQQDMIRFFEMIFNPFVVIPLGGIINLIISNYH